MEILQIFASPEAWVALLTLTVLELVLGIDNIVFISILASKLPPEQQDRARYIGLLLAMLFRLGLLGALAWIVRLTEPIFSIMEYDLSGRDLILLLGGLFLMYKATMEIHDKVDGDGTHIPGENMRKASVSFAGVLTQIIILDMVFSLDSVITAVGMVKELPIMIAAVVIAVGVMMFAAKPVARFVEKHQTVKMLALSFLLLIGVSLVAEGLHFHIPKGYIYFAMGFSVMVEALNLRVKSIKKRSIA